MGTSGVFIGEQGVYVSFVVLLIIGLIAGGMIEWFVDQHLSGLLPYTVCVFFAGAIISLILFTSSEGNSNAGAFINNSEFISGLILYLYLPILIFGETMNLNWNRSLKALNQSLWLAGPGVVIGTMLIACVAMYINKWSFQAACIFGAILSATDPVAVVSLLKTAGASQELTMLIVGESLLNDGTAIVVYELFFAIADGQTETAESVIVYFISASIGSVSLGIAIGLFTNFVMRRMDNPRKKLNMTVQVSITLIATYGSFVLAQGVLGISGVLCSSAAGLMLARWAPPIILHHEQMHAVWGILEWICNTLIFYFAGLTAAHRALHYFQIRDIYMVIIMYIFVMVFRGIMILVLYPILRRGPLPMSFQSAIFMNWAGLRGALAIALALTLESSGILDPETSSAIFIQTIGIVALTLLVNATSSKALLDYLNLRNVKEDQDITDLMKTRVIRQMTKVVDNKLFNSIYSVSLENLANKYCSYLNTVSVMKERTTIDIKSDARNNYLGHHSSEIKNTERRNPASSVYGELPESLKLDPGLLLFLRQKFYDSLHICYHDFVRVGKIPRSSYSAHTLLFTLDAAMESPGKKLCDWEEIVKNMEYSSTWMFLAVSIDFFCRKIFRIEAGYSNHLKSILEKRQIYVVSNFIDAHMESQIKIPSFLAGTDEDMFWMPEELEIKKESEDAVDRAKEHLSAKFDADALQEFWEQSAARIILHEQKEMIEDMVSDRMLSASTASSLMNQIDLDSSKLEAKKTQLHRAFVKERSHQLPLKKSVADHKSKANDMNNPLLA